MDREVILVRWTNLLLVENGNACRALSGSTGPSGKRVVDDSPCDHSERDSVHGREKTDRNPAIGTWLGSDGFEEVPFLVRRIRALTIPLRR